MSIRILTDSTCDLTPEEQRRLDVSVVPLRVIFEDGIYRDGVEITPAAFYEKQKTVKVLPKTTQVNPSEFCCVYEQLLSEGGEVVGIIERGEAAVTRIDESGVSTVLEELTCGGVFGKTLAFAGSFRDSLEVICRTPCEVLFIDYPHILKRCEKACTHHSVLVRNMLRLMADKAQNLSERVDVLSRRTIRDKLMCYFQQQADKKGSGTFTLPFSLSFLADYIATDRSAMMREMKHLREGGEIHTHGREITLCG